MAGGRDTSMPEIRMEMTPLMDVVFLLLTFFIFALVLTARLQVTQIELPVAASGADPDVAKYVVLALHEDGSLTLDGAPLAWDGAVETIKQSLANEEGTRLLVAPDARGKNADLFRLMGMLQGAEIRDLQFLRAPEESDGTGSQPDAGP
jgi:biopolymer transport protein ExbD